MFYVYVLLGKTNFMTYIGYTNDLDKRLKEHNSVNSGFTGNQKWDLVYYEAYFHEADARKRELKLKQRGQAKRQLFERISNSLASCKELSARTGERVSNT